MRLAAALALAGLGLASAGGEEACAPPPPAGALETVESAERLFAWSRRYDESPPERRDLFRITYRIAVEPPDAAPVCVTLRAADAETVWPAGPDGRLAPPTPDMVFAEAMVVARADADSLRVEAVFEPAAPLATRMDAGELARAAVQATRFLKRAQGLLGLASPGFNGVLFEWDAPAPSADAVYPDGRRAPLDVVYDQAWFLPGRDRALRRAERLDFARPPDRAALVP
ncbi:MAG: hypothetical protein MI723_04120 [Caulobacterales bacterium]|nr:hypothetical protein [Caulobacterales bacterium]